jgi:hypothetical protein
VAGEWEPHLEPSEGDGFKWALNGETGEFTIWPVRGLGDGYPSHDTYLATAWGRPPRPPGDLLGYASIDEETIEFVTYYGAPLPEQARQWARQQFPRHALK